jgi:hypothetical protein
MEYYIFIENGKINGAGQCLQLTEGVENYPVTEEVFNAFVEDPLLYVWDGEKVIENPNYEEDKQAQHRQELDQLTLTPADVERALYKAKGMDFDDLKALIKQALPTVDIKALSIEFRAKDFYRGAMANGMRLFDVVGALLGYTPADMDELFLTKELPSKEEEEPEE